jgi:hypothetical protein
MCLKDRMGNAERNPLRLVWAALTAARSAKTDLEAIRSIMQLTGLVFLLLSCCKQQGAKASRWI